MAPSVSVLTVFDCTSKFASCLYYWGREPEGEEGGGHYNAQLFHGSRHRNASHLSRFDFCSYDSKLRLTFPVQGTEYDKRFLSPLLTVSWFFWASCDALFTLHTLLLSWHKLEKKCEEIEAQKPITFMLLGPDCEPVFYHIHPYTPDELIFKSVHLREIFQYPNSVTKLLRHCPQIVVTSVNKTIHTPSPFLHSKWWLLFPTDSSNSGASLHRGCEEKKAFFSAFWSR